MFCPFCGTNDADFVQIQFFCIETWSVEFNRLLRYMHCICRHSCMFNSAQYSTWSHLERFLFVIVSRARSFSNPMTLQSPNSTCRGIFYSEYDACLDDPDKLIIVFHANHHSERAMDRGTRTDLISRFLCSVPVKFFLH